MYNNTLNNTTCTHGHVLRATLNMPSTCNRLHGYIMEQCIYNISQSTIIQVHVGAPIFKNEREREGEERKRERERGGEERKRKSWFCCVCCIGKGVTYK